MKIGYLMQEGVPDVRRSSPTGPARHVRQVFCGLAGLGHTVRLVACLDGTIWTSDDLSTFHPVAPRERAPGIAGAMESVFRRVQSELRLPYAAYFDSRRFASACVEHLAGFDILYERMGWMGYGGGLAAARLGTPLVLEVNGDHLTEYSVLGKAPTGLQRGVSLAVMRRAVHKATRTVATGHGWRRQHLANWGVPPETVCVVENGSEMVDLLDRGQLRAFDSREAAPGEPVVIVYVGSLEPWTGIPVLLRAVAAAFSQGANLRLVLAGAGTQEESLRGQVAESSLGQIVDFAGYLDTNRLAACLAAADVGVSPYSGRPEFSGLKLLDYKAAGLAVIASGEDGEPEIIEHGRTGWIVPPGDERALATAILQLAADRAIRRSLGRAARIEAENRHRWKHTVAILSDLLTELVSTDTRR